MPHQSFMSKPLILFILRNNKVWKPISIKKTLEKNDYEFTTQTE